jgi:hypothetical protein
MGLVGGFAVGASLLPYALSPSGAAAAVRPTAASGLLRDAAAAAAAALGSGWREDATLTSLRHKRGLGGYVRSVAGGTSQTTSECGVSNSLRKLSLDVTSASQQSMGWRGGVQLTLWAASPPGVVTVGVCVARTVSASTVALPCWRGPRAPPPLEPAACAAAPPRTPRRATHRETRAPRKPCEGSAAAVVVVAPPL